MPEICGIGDGCAHPANTRSSANVGTMLGQRLRHSYTYSKVSDFHSLIIMFFDVTMIFFYQNRFNKLIIIIYIFFSYLHLHDHVRSVVFEEDEERIMFPLCGMEERNSTLQQVSST